MVGLEAGRHGSKSKRGKWNLTSPPAKEPNSAAKKTAAFEKNSHGKFRPDTHVTISLNEIEKTRQIAAYLLRWRTLQVFLFELSHDSESQVFSQTSVVFRDIGAFPPHPDQCIRAI